MIIRVDENNKNSVINEWRNIFSKEFIEKEENFSDDMLNLFLDKLYMSFNLALASKADYSLVEIPYMEFFSDRYFEKYINQCVDSAVKILDIDSSQNLWNFKIYIFYNFYKKLDNRLKKSIEKRQNLIDSIGGILFITNKKGEAVWYNNAFSDFAAKFSNYSESKVIKVYFKDKICDLFKNKKENEVNIFNLVFNFDELNDKKVFKVTATKLRDNFVMVMGYDITNVYDIQEIETKLKSNELKLKFLLDNDASPMFLLDEEGVVVSANRFAKRFLSKFNSKNVCSKNEKFWDIDIFKNNKEELLNIFKENNQSSLSKCIEINDNVIYIRLSNIYDDKGEMLGILVNIIEDENLISIKNKYKEIKKMCDTICDLINDAIIVVENDKKHSIIYYNESASEIIGNNSNLSDIKNDKIIDYVVNVLKEEYSDTKKIYLNSNINTEININKIQSLNKAVIIIKSLYPLVADLKKNIEILNSNNKKLNSFKF